MEDFLFDMGVSALITRLRGLKSAEKKKKFKAVFLKVHKLIRGVYGDDPDFNFGE